MQQHPLSPHWDTIQSLEIAHTDFQAHLNDMEKLDSEIEELMEREEGNNIRANRYAFAIKLLRHLGVDPVSFQKLLNQKKKIDAAIVLGKVSKDSAKCLVDNLGILVARKFIHNIHDDVRTKLEQALYEKKEREFPPQLRVKGVPIKNPTGEIEEGIRQMFLDIFYTTDSAE